MEKIKELFSKHPYLIGGGALVTFVIFYYLFSRGSGSGSGTVYTAGSGSGGSDAQSNAIAAQENIAQLQASTALAAKQIDADVASQQIVAAHDIATLQTGAQLEGLKSNNDTQVQLAQVQAGQNEAQSKALEDIVTAQYTSQEHAVDAVYGYLSAVNDNANATQRAAITAQQSVDIASLSHVKDVNGSQNRTAIILGSTGNIAGSVAAENGQTASSISGDSLLKSIASGAGAALSALF